MKQKIAIAAAICLLASQALADPSQWAGLATFAGTYPAAGLMKSPLVQNELKALLSPKDRTRLSEMSVSPPVSAIGSDLLAQFCLPHDCASQSAVLVVDPARQRLWIGFYDNARNRVQMDWSGNDDPADVPANIQKQLAKIHSPF
jgi:hypothetical protein